MREIIEEFISDNRLTSLCWEDVDEAVRQLASGETLSDVQRRLSDWHHEYRREAKCDGRALHD